VTAFFALVHPLRQSIYRLHMRLPSASIQTTTSIHSSVYDVSRPVVHQLQHAPSSATTTSTTAAAAAAAIVLPRIFDVVTIVEFHSTTIAAIVSVEFSLRVSFQPSRLDVTRYVWIVVSVSAAAVVVVVVISMFHRRLFKLVPITVPGSVCRSLLAASRNVWNVVDRTSTNFMLRGRRQWIRLLTVACSSPVDVISCTYIMYKHVQFFKVLENCRR